jgi:DNA-binding LacI/PurR family transcriptional regulator
MATIIDVAKKAGVSKSTVSLVLNNNKRIPEKTSTLVRKAMKELGYSPNTNARGLINSHFYNFGVIECVENEYYGAYDISHETGTYAANVTYGILSGLEESPYGLITERWKNEKVNLPRLVQTKCVDGLFVIGTYNDDFLFEQIKKTHIPLVVIGRNVKDTNCIYSDPGEGSRMGVEYLLKRGHSRICFINAPSFFLSSKVRLQAIEEMLREKNIPEGTVVVETSMHNNGEGGRMAIDCAWKKSGPFDGVVAANDMMALGVLRFCYQNDIRVPQDLSIAAYEDSVLCGYSSPSLTSVNINKEMSGRCAAEMMIRLINEKNMSTEHICVPLSLVERESVKDR